MNERIGIRISVQLKQRINKQALTQSSAKEIVKPSDVAREALEIGLQALEAKSHLKQAA